MASDAGTVPAPLGGRGRGFKSPLTSPLNRALLYGYIPAWDDARKCDAKAKVPLHERVGDEAVCLCHFKSRKPLVHTVDSNNVYTAWIWSDSQCDWRECDPYEYNVDTRMAVLGAMHNKRRILESELESAKKELSQLRLDHELLRHDYERVRPKNPRFAFWKRETRFWSILAFVIMLLTFFAPTTHAATVEDDIFIYVNETATWVYSSTFSLFTSADIIPFLTSYRFSALVLAVFSMWKSESPLLMLVMLTMAYITRYRFVAIASSAYMTFTSTCTFGLVMLFDIVDPVAALYVAAIQFVVALVLGLVLDDVGYMRLVKGHFAVVGATILSFFTKFFEVPDMVVVAVMVVWRLFIIMQLTGDRLEVKDANGKVVTVVPSKPAWLAKATGLKEFVQSAHRKLMQKVRKKTVVPVRVLTNSILGIESGVGIGTGFRVANNIITASHVVGSDEVVRVTWGASVFSAKVLRHLGNDVAILNLPAEAHPVQPFKFAKECKDGTVVITGMNKNGDYIVAAAEGVIIGDQWTYAVQTLDGMSGAPVTNENGRIVGVHLSNTGFTGGGAVLRSSDVHEESEVEKLRREIAFLKSQSVSDVVPEVKAEIPKSTQEPSKLHLTNAPSDLSQREVHPLPESFVFDCTDIVGLIRDAVRREIEVLRHELDPGPMAQAKGKTKMKARLGKHKSKRVRAFTEEEYKALQEKGYTRDQLRDMAAVIIERMNEDSYDYDDGGYPEYADISEEERREIERDWLGTNAEHEDYVRDSYRQSYVVEAVPVESDYNPKTHPWDVHDKYSLSMYHVTEADVKIVGQALLDYDRFLTKWMARNLRGNEWQSGIDIAKELKELADAKLRLEILMTQNGLIPFCQRKKKDRKPRTIKKVPKNVKTPSSEGESPTQ